MLLEADAPEAEKGPITLPPATPTRRLGEPSSTELLEALREWIETDVKAKAQGRDRFMAAVAMNALGIMIRDTESPIDPHDAALSEQLLNGSKSLETPGLLAKLRKMALQKLANDSPKYASLVAAQSLWVTPPP
jgi:hypothetical protein